MCLVRIQPFLLRNAAFLILLGVVPSAPTSAGPKCQQLENACRSAGYLPGGPKPKRLWVDCIEPLTKGMQVAGVQLPADFKKADCAEERRNEASRAKICEKFVAACKSAGFAIGGVKGKPGSGLWNDCVEPLVNGKKVPKVKVPAGADTKGCAKSLKAPS